MATLLDPDARGRVILVGAGPGDPELLTVRAVKALGQADIVVHDGLIDRRVLDLAPAGAQRISVAKQRARHTLPQEAINALIVAHVKTGAIVVRLKGGDPFIFGRGGEEVEAVRAAGLPVEVVPGVSAALGCAAEAMLPLTHRDHSSAVSFVAGQCKGLSEQNWSGLAGQGRTLVIYMGVATADAIADKLMADGVAPDMPVAVLERGTCPDARALKTLLADLGPMVTRERVCSPAVIVVGEVVELSDAKDRLARWARAAEVGDGASISAQGAEACPERLPWQAVEGLSTNGAEAQAEEHLAFALSDVEGHSPTPFALSDVEGRGR